MKDLFLDNKLAVESISLQNPFIDKKYNMEISLQVFPSGKIQFDEQDISLLGFMLSSQTYKPTTPGISFGPYFFVGQQYHFADGKMIQDLKYLSNATLIQ